MILDSYLNGDNALDELVRDSIEHTLPEGDIFTTLSGVSPFSDEYYLSVPVMSDSDMSNALMELAFRYIAKVLVAVFCNDTNCDPLENSVAHRSIENLKWRLNGKYYDELKERYEYAVMKIFDYIDNGSDHSNSLVQQCWFLAKIDICYRKGAIPSDINQFFQPATNEEAQELLELALIFRKNFISKIVTPTSKVIFNPSFEFGEHLVGETDCDMIIDRTMVDLRADIGTFFPRNRIIKSMVHYFLTEINSRFRYEKGDYPIDNLAFYSARYGETEVLNLDDISPRAINKTLEKLIVVTEAKYKRDYNDDSENSEYTERKFQSQEQERFLEDDQRFQYNDDYNQVIEKKNHHIFRKLLIFIIIASLLTVGFVYAKNWYTDTYGAEYSIEQIFHNLFDS